jgi:pantoate--beta-alanine ligase
MQVIRTAAELRHTVSAWRRNGERIALVPTMGNLHDGHLQLVREARAKAERIVVSIFVNPMQFVDAEGRLGDYERYPRTLEADLAKLSDADAVFTPEVNEVYPNGFQQQTRVKVPDVSDILCGAYRPGHFVGVATVVAKLFNLAQPDVALFGEKDFQQLLVIRRLSAELCFPIEIVGVPTVREPDGLAMSSRNQYLSAAERRQAAALFQTLTWVREQVRAGNRQYDELQREAAAKLQQAGFRPDYVAIRRADNLETPGPDASNLVVLAAAWLGAARLIDNVRVSGRD